ncbi:MAG: glycosyltransferase family 2 protein [Ignavibacteria bacterium]|nr:glycosyltransferase family 2 protein [Ignavibacteria bacterium]
MTTIYDKRIPFFSVIIPTFNRAALLPRALKSLLSQSEHDWEGIICDDGSTDETFDIAKAYIAKCPNIRYVYHQNRGTGLTRNSGLLAACGIYATFLDSDDEYLPTHLAIRKEILLDYPEADLLHDSVKIIGETFVPDKNNPYRSISLADCVIGGTFFVKRELALGLGGFSALRYADDADFFERAQKAGFTIGETDAQTYIYHRDTPDSLCTSYFPNL